jgi:hypothetical protein
VALLTHGASTTPPMLGTMDLDAAWVHENGPGKMICPGIAAMCKAHPGVFELGVGGCGNRLHGPLTVPTPAGLCCCV